jgi:Tol biopolymer transport system component
MSLPPGTRLGPYEVSALIGVGGMGEVYRATDTKLGRAVAIKVLPESVARSAERLARFDREARTLALVNHPNIAAIYGLEDAAVSKALVMELVEGSTVADLLLKGAIPVDEALLIARQIAEALEAAHERGIIHRDLKPANIKRRPDGTVKVLDFGLAKAIEPTGATRDGQAEAMTITTPAMTQAGIVLGTAAYMSPEQARGADVDRRTDIWAFGCVVYEMLSGRPAFAGQTVPDTLAAIVGREPDWTVLPTDTPPVILRLLRRCLRKERNARLDSAAVLRMEIDESRTQTETQTGVIVKAKPSGRGWVSALVVGLLVMAVSVVLYFSPTAVIAPETRLEMSTPSTMLPLHFALSPDGRRVVFVASGEGAQRLWLRPLDDTAARPIAGTDGAEYPFWSTDGRSIGFFTAGELYRIELAGGAAQHLAAGGSGTGGSWSADGSILFTPNLFGPVFAVAASGGQTARITEIDASAGGHRFPSFLPDGRRFLFYSTDPKAPGIYLGSRDGGTPKRLIAAQTFGAFLPPDRIVFVREQALVAQRLDLRRGELTGESVTLADGVGYDAATGLGGFSVSRNGVVAYRSGSTSHQLTWYDRSGKPEGEVGKPDFNNLLGPALSPDERTVAVSRTVQNNSGVWVIDLRRGGVTPLTADAGVESHAVWSPTGERVAYESSRDWNIFTHSTNGPGVGELLVDAPELQRPADWSREGILLYDQMIGNSGQHDIWAMEVARGARTATRFVASSADERNAQFSPDGRWVAYETNESGEYQIVVQSFPTPTRTRPVSIDGGVQPRWRADGRELYFIGPGKTLMAAPVTAFGSTFEVGKPVALFSTRIVSGRIADIHAQYAVSRDGRFLINETTDVRTAPITLILNWVPR